jgi:ATP-dependent helicase HrpA
LVDQNGQVMGQGRDLAGLAGKLKAGGERASLKALRSKWERAGMTDWDGPALPGYVEAGWAGWRMIQSPALTDEGKTVAVRLYPDWEEAARQHRKGLIRLLHLRLAHNHRGHLALPGFSIQALEAYRAQGGALTELIRSIQDRGIEEICLGDRAEARDREAFEACLGGGLGKLHPFLLSLAGRIEDVLAAAWEVMEEWGQEAGPGLDDLRGQMGLLIRPGFVLDTPLDSLGRFTVYFKGMRLRRERMRHGPQKDLEKMARFGPYLERYLELITHPRPQAYDGHALREYRWMLEEWRISLFAQELGTALPVSPKRLEEQWERAVKPGKPAP